MKTNRKARRLRSAPQKYVVIGELRQLLALALALHRPGDPITKLTASLRKIARLTGSDSWVVAARGEKLWELAGSISGRTPSRASVATLARAPGRLIAGRVRAGTTDSGRAIDSVLRREGVVTWVSLHRHPTCPAFGERERRLAELFHSQSAWLLEAQAIADGSPGSRRPL